MCDRHLELSKHPLSAHCVPSPPAQPFTVLTGTASWGFSLVYLRTLSKYSLVYLWERVLLGSSVPYPLLLSDVPHNQA